MTNTLETLINPYMETNSSCASLVCWETVICGVDEPCQVLCIQPLDNERAGCVEIPFEFYSYPVSIKCIYNSACTNVEIDAYNTSQLSLIASGSAAFARSFLTSSAINANITCNGDTGIYYIYLSICSAIDKVKFPVGKIWYTIL